MLMCYALHGCAHQFSRSLSVSEPWQFQYCQCELDLRCITLALSGCTVLLNIACSLSFTPQCTASSDCYVVKAVGCFLHHWRAEAAEQWECMQYWTNSIRPYSSLKPSEAHKFVNLAWRQLVWPRLTWLVIIRWFIKILYIQYVIIINTIV